MVRMFGDALTPAESTESTTWIDDACRGEPWTVGGLVPNHYDSTVRVYAPAPCENWWPVYRELFSKVADVGERHTSTPECAWYGVWEGHGFGQGSIGAYWPDPPADEEERRAREAGLLRARDTQARKNTSIRAGLARMPRFARPGRSYFLLTGSVAAVSGMRYPDHSDWRNPDLFWPDDRRWFVGTDVDFWSLYIGGSTSFVDEIVDSVPTRSDAVELDFRLEDED